MSVKKCGVVLVLLAVLAGVATASAGAASADSIKTEDGKISISYDSTQKFGIVMPMSVQGTIKQGETQWKSRVLSGYATRIEFDLYWGNPSNSLRMKIYAPDGSVWGPLYDNCDGRLDGFIPCILTCSSGLPQGTYYVEIYGDRVIGLQSYTLY